MPWLLWICYSLPIEEYLHEDKNVHILGDCVIFCAIFCWRPLHLLLKVRIHLSLISTFVTMWRGKYQNMDNTKIGKEKISYWKNEEISGRKAHTKHKLIWNVSTITDAFLGQKRVNVCEHTVKNKPCELTLFWPRKTSVIVETFQLSFSVFFVCLSSGDLFIFSVKDSSFIFYFLSHISYFPYRNFSFNRFLVKHFRK